MTQHATAVHDLVARPEPADELEMDWAAVLLAGATLRHRPEREMSLPERQWTYGVTYVACALDSTLSGCLTDRASAAATPPVRHYPTFLRPEACQLHALVRPLPLDRLIGLPS